MRTAGVEVLSYQRSIILQTTFIQRFVIFNPRYKYCFAALCADKVTVGKPPRCNLGNSLGTIVDPFLGIGLAMRPKIDHTKALSTVIMVGCVRSRKKLLCPYSDLYLCRSLQDLLVAVRRTPARDAVFQERCAQSRPSFHEKGLPYLHA